MITKVCWISLKMYGIMHILKIRIMNSKFVMSYPLY